MPRTHWPFLAAGPRHLFTIFLIAFCARRIWARGQFDPKFRLCAASDCRTGPKTAEWACLLRQPSGMHLTVLSYTKYHVLFAKAYKKTFTPL
jgi:hypothetical protein